MTLVHVMAGLALPRYSSRVRIVARALAWLRWQVDIHRARKALHALPDYALKDMGLARSDIDYAVVYGRDANEQPVYRR